MAKKSPVSSPPPGLRPDRSQLADLASLAAMKASRMGSQETGNSESGEADDAEESTTNARQSSLHTNTGKSLAEIRTEEERNAVGEDGRKEQPHGSAESSMPGVEATDGAEGNNILNRSDDRWENLPSAGGTPTRQGTVSTSEALDEADDEFSSPGIR